MLTARQKSVLQKQVGSVRAEYRNSFLLSLEFKLNLVSNPVRFAWIHLIIFQPKTAMVLVYSFCGRSLTGLDR